MKTTSSKIVVLEPVDRHTLEVMFNYEIHKVKLRRANLEGRFLNGELPQHKRDSGARALAERIKYLRKLRQVLK